MITFFTSFTYLIRTIRASIVNKQQFKVGECLGEDAFDAAGKIFLYVVDGTMTEIFGKDIN